MIEVAVLVSAGRHPVSGRERRSPADARALEIGLRLADGHPVALHVLHAGGSGSEALREYLGMGVDRLEVVDVPEGRDPVPALIQRLRTLAPALVLTGVQAESGRASGFVPYAIAAALGYALAPAVAGLALEDGAARILQALPRGRRRALRARLPAVATVGDAGPAARPVAYARARRGRLIVTPAADAELARSIPEHGQEESRPARARPRRLTAVKGRTAAERLHALASGPEQRARVLRPASATEAAREILACLAARGLHKPTRLMDRSTPNR